AVIDLRDTLDSNDDVAHAGPPGEKVGTRYRAGVGRYISNRRSEIANKKPRLLPAGVLAIESERRVYLRFDSPFMHSNGLPSLPFMLMVQTRVSASLNSWTIVMESGLPVWQSV